MWVEANSVNTCWTYHGNPQFKGKSVFLQYNLGIIFVIEAFSFIWLWFYSTDVDSIMLAPHTDSMIEKNKKSEKNKINK